ncbi:ABC transporter ATP-binding protein [Azovibrio restrictus]|uniref:ABC transporter ATP-binding protein n=1 Tax=Azovibrio restrictus TaxID=146938 RepID=UPI0026EE3731|nr:ABC transporter ATP-binding protein [Azovibrio restrictus]MDD3481551.1 ABC transporter ATP-binding protein [Azovibrio restrictus]
MGSSVSPAAVPAVAFTGVVKRFGAFTALDGVDLEIAQGEFFGLLGPNGAGKTTLISCLAGLARPSAGSIRVLGHEVQVDYREARRRLGVVPQELVFDPFFTVRETLRIQSGYFGIRRNDDWIDEILANLDLADKADTNMRRLSGGMKRRVLVAQALVHRPPVIVLDEPTAGVDVELRQGLWRFIRRLNEAGHTIVLTTHYLEEAEALCQRIALLKRGRILALDSTANLLARFSGHSLTLKLSGEQELPSSLEPLVQRRNGREVVLQLNRLEQVETVLASLRQAGLGLEDLRLNAPDLEDAFMALVGAEASHV